MPTTTADQLTSAVKRIVEAAGTPPDHADIVARVLVGSHLAGHDSHGVQHLPRYVTEVEVREIVPDASPEIISDKGGAALVKGNWAWGHVTADFVTRLAISKAREHGIAVVSAVEVNHIGRLGEYVETAAAEAMVSLMVSGGHAEDHPTAAPYGGAKAVLAPNPIAIGFPTTEGHPIVVDFATTRTSGGKVELLEAKGQEVPLGYLIDENGNPTTDPAAFKGGGSLLPFGEHKGFGVMVAVEILGRILSGADDYSDTPHGGVFFRHVGITMIVLDSGLFGSADSFAARGAELANRVRSIPPAPGFEKVLVAGDYEHLTRTARLNEGFNVEESTWSEVLEAAAGLGVEI